jgi:hypothetical protein
MPTKQTPKQLTLTELMVQAIGYFNQFLERAALCQVILSLSVRQITPYVQKWRRFSLPVSFYGYFPSYHPSAESKSTSVMTRQFLPFGIGSNKYAVKRSPLMPRINAIYIDMCDVYKSRTGDSLETVT